MTDLDRPWTPDEAAAWFSVTVVTIRRWVREGRLARIPTGGALRITAASVSRLSRGEYDGEPDGQGQGNGHDHPDCAERMASQTGLKTVRGPNGTRDCDSPRTR
jgi:excisionase family DNA binding protein